MANVRTGGLVAKNQQQAVATAAKAQNTLGVMVNSKGVQDRFEKMLGKKAPAFLSSLLTMTNQNELLQKCNPQTVLSAAAIAASLDLPINPSLGFAWIVPYKTKAQFQMGYKGLIQLAQRSGLMKSIVSTEVYEGEIVNFNRFTETFETGERLSDAVVGYYASFELVNGFKKCVYWEKDAVLKHAKRFSKSFNSGPWQTDFDAMAKKTVLSALLRTYSPLSTAMQRAVEFDGTASEINAKGDPEVIDLEPDAYEAEAVDPIEDGLMVNPETGEVLNA